MDPMGVVDVWKGLVWMYLCAWNGIEWVYVSDGCVRMWMNVESSWGAQELACPLLLLVLFVVVVVGAALVVGGF
jgi:hypothetical protein